MRDMRRRSVAVANSIREFGQALAPPCNTMDLAWNPKSVSGCAAVCLLMRLRHPKVAELCNLHAAAPEGGEYLLLVRQILEPQQVSSPVTNNKVKHGYLLAEKCLCRYTYSMLSITTTAHECVGNLQCPRKKFFIFVACITGQLFTHYLQLTMLFWFLFITGYMLSDQYVYMDFFLHVQDYILIHT